jgi:hypothetical protein
MTGEPAEFHCHYATNEQEVFNKGRYVYGKYQRYLSESRPTIDLGCGEGALLLCLQQMGFKDILGIELNNDLYELAKSLDAPVIQADIIEFLKNSNSRPAVYLYLDVMEHVSFEFNNELLNLIPVGSRLIIQTPYTHSILGHEFFMNVPSHVAPYSPRVIKDMLRRLGYEMIDEGTVDGNHPVNWRYKIRSLFIRKVLAVDPVMILGGGNYYIVADRTKDTCQDL